MNAWGLSPVHQLSAGILRVNGPYAEPLPSNTGLTDEAIDQEPLTIEGEVVDTDHGMLVFLQRSDLIWPTLAFEQPLNLAEKGAEEYFTKLVELLHEVFDDYAELYVMSKRVMRRIMTAFTALQHLTVPKVLLAVFAAAAVATEFCETPWSFTANAANLIDPTPAPPFSLSKPPSEFDRTPLQIPPRSPPTPTFNLPMPATGILRPGHGIAGGIVMPTDVSRIRLDAQEIYRRNVKSVMLIVVQWDGPVAEDEIPHLSDKPGKDGGPSLRKQASDSIAAGHPMMLHKTSSGSGVAIFKTTEFASTLLRDKGGEVTYYLTNCHVLDMKTVVQGATLPIFNDDLAAYSTSHTISIQNQSRNKDEDNPIIVFQPSSDARLVEAHPDIDVCVVAHTEARFWDYAGDPIPGIRPFSDLKVGERVFAIGNPSPGKEGPLTWSLTDGIISALRKGEEIQISAAIYHGNSGGGLFDEYGNLIGIPTKGYMETAQGFNFAIAADKIWTRYGK
jgi:S1-C subfamily serine protease